MDKKEDTMVFRIYFVLHFIMMSLFLVTDPLEFLNVYQALKVVFAKGWMTVFNRSICNYENWEWKIVLKVFYKKKISR